MTNLPWEGKLEVTLTCSSRTTVSAECRPSAYLSRIIYEEGEWIVYDGDGENPSTNGIWFLVRDYETVEENDSFKVGSTVFEANFAFY